jgi:hypothetical protein
MAVATAYKVRIKLGQAEFDAEGPEDTVKKNLAEFLEIAPTCAERVAKEPRGFDFRDLLGPPRAPNNKERADASAVTATETPSSTRETSVDPRVLNRLFKDNGDGLISLRVLPKQSEDRAADTLFLLLYGFLILKGQSEVMSRDLLTCARQSGVSLDRIDHTLDRQRYHSLYTRGGSRTGTRYALTNPGILRAEEVASGIFG